MTWVAVWDTATGALVSVGTVVASPLPAGMSSTDVGATQPIGVWNPSTHAFDPAPVIATPMSRLEFLQRFTTAERLAIRASTDPGVSDFLFLLDHADTVTTTDALTQQGVNYLVSLGLLTATRAAQILA